VTVCVCSAHVPIVLFRCLGSFCGFSGSPFRDCCLLFERSSLCSCRFLTSCWSPSLCSLGLRHLRLVGLCASYLRSCCMFVRYSIVCVWCSVWVVLCSPQFLSGSLKTTALSTRLPPIKALCLFLFVWPGFERVGVRGVFRSVRYFRVVRYSAWVAG
jgi:hypothetical protein